jgi:hypothetical protein
MELNWKKLREYLHTLGVDFEGSEGQGPPDPEEPILMFLQMSHQHQAVYRIDLLETGPELLVLLPTDQAPLKFHFYLVKLSEARPLGDALIKLMAYQGSEGFEQERGVAEWQLLHAMVEIMKALFWAGQETSQFPPEITVQKIL